MRHRAIVPFALVCAILLSALSSGAQGEDQPTKPARAKRLLLIGQSPDGHPFSTHEYMAGVGIVAKLISRHARETVQTILVSGDEPWRDGPRMLDSADAAVVFVSEGGKWLHQDPQRLAAFKRLAKRGGGLVCLHWGMGAKEAKYIQEFRDLFGGCHGGPDRKYKVVETQLSVLAANHPIVRGIASITLREEFYYRLKLVDAKGFTPLMQAEIEGEAHTVCWAWERADGGRSFGFSGLHFHDNWNRPEYRRLVTQAALWTLKVEIPESGINVDVRSDVLKVPPRPIKAQERQSR
ncbi:MAG: ThuA domain-containing protein [Planctomycetota bacterium]|nr:ThuA domain-containing protein [Planctomycetota bacterium]